MRMILQRFGKMAITGLADTLFNSDHILWRHPPRSGTLPSVLIAQPVVLEGHRTRLQMHVSVSTQVHTRLEIETVETRFLHQHQTIIGGCRWRTGTGRKQKTGCHQQHDCIERFHNGHLHIDNCKYCSEKVYPAACTSRKLIIVIYCLAMDYLRFL